MAAASARLTSKQWDLVHVQRASVEGRGGGVTKTPAAGRSRAKNTQIGYDDILQILFLDFTCLHCPNIEIMIRLDVLRKWA